MILAQQAVLGLNGDSFLVNYCAVLAGVGKLPIGDETLVSCETLANLRAAGDWHYPALTYPSSRDLSVAWVAVRLRYFGYKPWFDSDVEPSSHRLAFGWLRYCYH